MTMLFVSAPYSSSTPAVVEDRVRAVEDACAWLKMAGYLPLSPVAHWHRPAFRNGLPTNALAWTEWNREWLRAADGLVVLQIDGWRDSQGVAMEVKWARDAGMAIWPIGISGGKFLWAGGEEKY